MALLFLMVFTFGLDGSPVGGAQMTGIGLDWNQNIFIQEYWLAGQPRYAIANQGGAAARIAAYQAQTGKKIAGPWEVPARQVSYVDASGLVGENLIALKLESGKSLGMLQAPRLPAGPAPATKTIVTIDGLNGSGGRSEDLWIEQPSLTFKPESTATITLVVRSNVGEISFGLEKLPRLEAACDTLTVKTSEERVVIDTSRPTPDIAYNRVTLRFRTPKADHPMMMVVDGWHWSAGRKGGHGVTRGIVIDPK